MKFYPLLVVPIVLASTYAQEKELVERRRVILPEGSPSGPNVSIHAGSVSSTTLEPELKKMLDSFYAKIRAGSIEIAWKQLLEGSRIGEEKKIVDEFISKTQEIIKVHGKVVEVELLRVRSTGVHLREVNYQLSCKDHPTRWRIYAYQTGNRWQILNIDVSSDLTRMFE